MEATVEGLAVRVRDVEIALVLARELKAAAGRDVDASLRLEQLREVFGAEGLEPAERARIQTALQMAGLEPRPSLLDVDPSEPIRFAVDGTETARENEADAPAEEAPPVATNGHAPVEVQKEEPEPPVEESEEAAAPDEPGEPEAAPAPEPQAPAAELEAARPLRPALLLAAAAVPVLVASFAGWLFGLAFVALSLVAVGLVREARSMRTVLLATLAVTAASLAVSIVLAAFDDNGGSTASKPVSSRPAAPAPPAKAPKPAPKQPAAVKHPAKKKKPSAHKPPARKPARRHAAHKRSRAHARAHHSRSKRRHRRHDDTSGLVLVPPQQ